MSTVQPEYHRERQRRRPKLRPIDRELLPKLRPDEPLNLCPPDSLGDAPNFFPLLDELDNPDPPEPYFEPENPPVCT
jgi:hypothetical protein